jgi:hypothetical protein
VRYEHHLHIQNKAISVEVRGRSKCCEMLWVSHYLDNRLINGGYIVNLRRRPHPQIYIVVFISVRVSVNPLPGDVSAPYTFVLFSIAYIILTFCTL